MVHAFGRRYLGVLVVVATAACAPERATAPSPGPGKPLLSDSVLAAGRLLLRHDATAMVSWPGVAESQVRWRSADSNVAIVGSAGLVAAVNPGATWIVGEQPSGVVDSLALTVVPGADPDSAVSVAHRGFARLFPENTLEAVDSALQRGAGVVEVDVRFTRDGVPVIIHDATLDRTTDRAGAVASQTFAEVRQANACARFSAVRWPRCTVPSLDEVLASLPTDRFLLLDLKERPSTQAVRGIVDAVRRAERQQQVMYIAFDPQILKAIREYDAAVPLGLLSGVRIAPEVLQPLGRVAALAHFSAFQASGDYTALLRARGFDAFAWTVPDRTTAEQIWRNGARRQIADEPLLPR